MPSPRRRARRLALLVITAVTAGAAVVLGGAPASAHPVTVAPDVLPFHARLTSSVPADGSSVDAVTEVRLTFSEEVNPSFVAVTVTGPEGDEAEGGPQVDGRQVTQRLSPDLSAGEHVATFRVVSADGHPVSGTVRFTTTQDPPSPSASPSPTPTATPSTATSTPSAEASTAGTAPDDGAAERPVSSADASSPPWVLVALGLLVLGGVLGGAFWRARRGASDQGDPSRQRSS